MVENPEINSLNSNKILSILVSRDGFYFCISQDNKKVTAFYQQKFSSPQRPEELLREIRSALTHSFKEEVSSVFIGVKVIYAHTLYALVPRPYFLEEKLSDYLKFNTRLMSTDEMTYDKLITMNANLVYVPFTNINNFLYDQFGQFTFKHAVGLFVDQCKQKENEGINVYINVYPTHFDLCVFDDGDLKLCNSFDYFSPEDFVYYVLFVFEQLKLDPETVALFLCGEIDKDSKTFDLLFTYVRDVSFLEKNQGLILKNTPLEEAEQHHYQLLLNDIAHENNFRKT